ncbi:MAG: hemolysin III family protein [Defluviitaleaceae bacterium]|nr:hemolysin III family protein [Defluviitaleaceae bacterium]
MGELRSVRPWTNKFYTLGEEIFSSVAHGVGTVLAIAGASVLAVFAGLSRDPWVIVACAIYGLCLILLYTMSTLYHSFTNEKVKALFRIFDHCGVFLLIAGTYTPFTLVTLRGGVGWALFGAIWGAAIIGIILKSLNLEKFKRFSLICYLGMGWAIVFAFRPLVENMPTNGLILLALGGLFYTVGVIFYKMKKLKYAHSIWHLFVLAGSIVHYFCVLFYVAL